MAQLTTIYHGSNPSQLYMDSLIDLINRGREVSPRGKRIKELRPVTFEFHNPLNRVTFLKGRVINPFFQLAESLWILAGRSDVQWLTAYNKSIAQFSDDGEFFNAPYGERLRMWNKSDANQFIFNPMDQLSDVVKKIIADPDTRQAIAVIYNPIFDNADKDTKDRPCNMLLEFKQRDGKLDLTVVNRSNDLHWGTFGANLCQFATIQEVMSSWLGLGVGVYFQQTDSLHIYLDDYGSGETNKVLGAYGIEEQQDIIKPVVDQFVFDTEPRFSSSMSQFNDIIEYYFEVIDEMISDINFYKSEQAWKNAIHDLSECPDEYLAMTFQAMVVKHAHNYEATDAVIEGLKAMKDSSWKVSCLRFLSKRYGELEEFQSVYSHFTDDIKDYIERKGE